MSVRPGKLSKIIKNCQKESNVDLGDQAADLLCTDITTQGLRFPAIHLVVQLNCPGDANRVEKQLDIR